MTSVEKRRSGRKSGGHRKHSDGGYSDTSSGGSFLDETDREVSNLTDRAFRSLCIGDEAVYNDSDLCSSSPCTQRDRQLAFSQTVQDREDREREELKRVAHESFSLRVQQYGQDWIHGGMYGAEIHRDPQWEVYGERTQGRVSATFQHSFVETSQQEESLREEQLSLLSNGATELGSQQRRSRSRVSSLIRAFNSEGQRDGAGTDAKLRDWKDETSWDKSALMSIQRELSEFSTSYQQNFNSVHFPSAGPYSAQDTNFYSSEVAAVAHMNSASSFMRSSHSKHSMAMQDNCNSNFFIHSEFSPFKVWRDHNRFPFQRGEVSGFMHCSEFPKWYETPMYKELSLDAQPQGPHRYDQRGIRHPRNNMAPVVPSAPSRSTSTFTTLQKALAVEKRCESELAGHYPPRKRMQSLGPNRLPSQRPSTASPTVEMSRRVQDTISSVKALQQKIKTMTEQNIVTGMTADQQGVLYSNSNLIPFGNNAQTVAPNVVDSNTGTTPLNISQMPLVHANQELVTSEVQQYAVSPQPVEHAPVRAESRGATPDVRMSSYKSRATSLLFNLKDNRKRVKSTYSPTKFKGLETMEKNRQPSIQEPRDTVIDIPDFPDPDIQFSHVEESSRANVALHQYANQYQPATAHTGQYSEYASSDYQTAQMQGEMVHHSGFTGFIPENYASNQLANGQYLHEGLSSFTPYKQGMMDNVETMGDVYRPRLSNIATEPPRLNADKNQTREYLISKANTEQHFNETAEREFTKEDRYQYLKDNKHDYSNVSLQDRWRQTNSQDTDNFSLKTAISPWKQEITVSMAKDQHAQAYQRAVATQEELNLPRDNYRGEYQQSREKEELRENFGVGISSHKNAGLVNPNISNQLPQYAPFINDTVENPAMYGQQPPGVFNDRYVLQKYYGHNKENEIKDDYVTQNYIRYTDEEYRNPNTLYSNKDKTMLTQETDQKNPSSLQALQSKPRIKHNMQKSLLSNPDNASALTMSKVVEDRQFYEVKAEQAMAEHIKAQYAQAELAKAQHWAQVEQPKVESARLILAGHTGSEKVKVEQSKAELTEHERVNRARTEHVEDKRKEEKTEQSRETQLDLSSGEQAIVQPKMITEKARAQHMREVQGEQVKAEPAEAQRLKEEHIKTEPVKSEQARIKQAKTEQARSERIKAQQHEEERVRAEKVERERIEEERIRTEKVRAEQAEPECGRAEEAKLEQIKEQQAKVEQVRIEQIKEQQAKAEQARLEQIKEQQSKAEQARLEQIKEQQAKAEQARLQQIKEQQAKAEQARLRQIEQQQAKVEQARLEEIKEQQAKAEQVRLEQIKEQQAKAEQARLEQIKEQQAKAEQARLQQIKEQQSKAEQVRLEQIKEQQAKAEQARLEQIKEQQAKAEQARLEQIKEQQAKAEQARLEQIKEQQAKAEQARLQQMKEQQAKAEQARLEQIKEQQAKAEQARLEQIKEQQAKEQQAKAEQARLEQIKEQQTKAEQARLEQIKEQQAKAEQARLEQMKEQQTKAEQARLEEIKEQQAKAEQARLEQIKEQQAKAEQVRLEQIKEQQAKAEQARLEQIKEQQAKAEQARLEQIKEQQAKAEQARLEQMKEQQAKAEQARLEEIKEQQATAEQARLEQIKEQQAKAEQARLDQIKEQQAKAEQARLEQIKEKQVKAEQERLEQIKEQQAKVEQARPEQIKEQQAKAEQARLEQIKEQQAKAEQARIEQIEQQQAKAEQARLEQNKEQQAKAEQARLEQIKEQQAKAEQARLEQIKEQQAKAEQARLEQVKEQQARVEQVRLEQIKQQQAKAEQVSVQQIKENQATAEQEKANVVAELVEDASVQASEVDAEHATIRGKAKEEKVEVRKTEQTKFEKTKVELDKAENMQERSAKPPTKLALTPAVKSEPDKVEQVKTELAKAKAELAKIKEKMRGEQKVRNIIQAKEDSIKKDALPKANVGKNEEHKDQDQVMRMHQSREESLAVSKQSINQANRGAVEYNRLREKYGFTDTTSTNRNKPTAAGNMTSNYANETPALSFGPTSRFDNTENKVEVGSLKSNEETESHYVYSESSKEFKLSSVDNVPTNVSKANNDSLADKVKGNGVEKMEKSDPLKHTDASQQRDSDLTKPLPHERKPKSIEHSGPGKDLHFTPSRALSHKERAQTKQEILTSKIKAHAEKEISAIKEKGFALRDGFMSKTAKQISGSHSMNIRQKPPSQEVSKKHESTLSSNTTQKQMEPSGIQMEPVKSLSTPSSATIPVKSTATTGQLDSHSWKQVPIGPVKSSENVPKLAQGAKQTGIYTMNKDEGVLEDQNDKNQPGIKSPIQSKEQAPKNKQGKQEANHGEISGEQKVRLKDNPVTNNAHLNLKKEEPSQVSALVKAESSKPMTAEKSDSKQEAAHEDAAPSLNLYLGQNETTVADDSLKITGIMVTVRERKPSVSIDECDNGTHEQMNAKDEECSKSELFAFNPSSSLEVSKENKSSKEVCSEKANSRILQNTHPTVDQIKVGMNNHPGNVQEASVLETRQNNMSEDVTAKMTNHQHVNSSNTRTQRESQLQQPQAENVVPSTVTVPAKNKALAETQPLLNKQNTIARETKDNTNNMQEENSIKSLRKDDVKRNTEENNPQKWQTTHNNENSMDKTRENSQVDNNLHIGSIDIRVVSAVSERDDKEIVGIHHVTGVSSDVVAAKEQKEAASSITNTLNNEDQIKGSPESSGKQAKESLEDKLGLQSSLNKMVNSLKISNQQKSINTTNDNTPAENGKPEKLTKSGKPVGESKMEPMEGDYFQVQGVAETKNEPHNSANVCGDTSNAVSKGRGLPGSLPNKTATSNESCNEGRNEVFALDQSKMKAVESSSVSVHDENMKRKNRETQDNLASKQSDGPTERQSNKNEKTEAGHTHHIRKQHTEKQSSFSARERQSSRNSHPTRENTVKESIEAKPKLKERTSIIPEISAIADYARLKVIVSEDRANDIQEFPPNKKEGFFPLIQSRHSRRPVFTADPQDFSVKEKSLPNKTEVSSKENQEPKPKIFPITEKEHLRTGMFKLGDKERREKMLLDAEANDDVLDTGAKHVQHRKESNNSPTTHPKNQGSEKQVAGTDTQVDQSIHQPSSPPLQATNPYSAVSRPKNTSLSQHLNLRDNTNTYAKTKESSSNGERRLYLDKNSNSQPTLEQMYKKEESKQTILRKDEKIDNALARIGDERLEKLGQERLATRPEETTAKQSRAKQLEEEQAPQIKVEKRAEEMKIKHIIEESRASLAEEQKRAAKREEERRVKEREAIAMKIKERREKQREAGRRAEEERKAKQTDRERAALKEEEMRAKQREEERNMTETEEKRRIKQEEEERRAKLREDEQIKEIERQKVKEQEEKEQQRRAAQEEQQRRAEQEEQQRRAAQEEQQRRAALIEEQQRRAAQEEQQRRAAQEEQQRRAAQEEQQRRAAQEEQQRRAAQEEQQRRAALIEEQQRRAAQEEQQKRAAQEEQQRRAAQEEQQRRAALIEEQQRRAAQEEQQKRAAQEEQQRRAALIEEQQRRAAQEEQQKRAAQEEQQRRAALIEEQQRRAAQEEQQRRAALIEEQQRRAAKEVQQRRAAQEEEQKRKAAQEEQQRRAAQEEQQRRVAQEEEQKRKAEKEEQQRRIALIQEQQRKVSQEEQQRREEEERLRLIHEQKTAKRQNEEQRSERQRREEWMRTQKEEKRAKRERARLLEESQATLKEGERASQECILAQREDETREEEEKLAAYKEKERAAQMEEQKRATQRMDALQYYAITSTESERKPRERQICSPLLSQRRNNPAVLESTEDSRTDTRHYRPHAPASPAPSLPRSNTSSPALGVKPSMFRVKDNTIRGSSFTKSVKPRFHKNFGDDLRAGSPMGSERGEEEHETIRHGAVTPLQADTGLNRLAAIRESPNFQQTSSSQDYSTPLPYHRPRSRRSFALDEDDSRSVISYMSEDVESFATSAADLADVRGLYDYDRPESACSFSSDVSRSLGKPPTVPPKSEKALRRAKRLTTRRIKKELSKGVADSPSGVEKPPQEFSSIPSSSSTEVRSSNRHAVASPHFSPPVSLAHAPALESSLPSSHTERRSSHSSLYASPHATGPISLPASPHATAPVSLPVASPHATGPASHPAAPKTVADVPSSPTLHHANHPAPVTQYQVESSYPRSYPLTQRKVLQDLGSGQYFVVDVPVQVKTKTFFDPETGKYVQLNVRESAKSTSRPQPQQTYIQPQLQPQIHVKPKQQPLSQDPPAGKPHELYQGYHGYPQGYQPAAINSVSQNSSSAPVTLHQDQQPVGEDHSCRYPATEMGQNSEGHRYSPEKTPYMDTVNDTDKPYNTVYNSHAPYESFPECDTNSQLAGSPVCENDNAAPSRYTPRDIITMGELEDFMEVSDW